MAHTTTIPPLLRRSGLALACLVLPAWGPLGREPPTLQDVQVAARVLHFQIPPFEGEVVVAIVFDAAQPASRTEASALRALFGDSLTVGNLTLRPKLVEQAELATGGSYGAIFITSGIDNTLLAAGLRGHRVLCLTRHLEQVEHGACVVAIGSEPQVAIVVNEANATANGLQFATAFRMMVREL